MLIALVRVPRNHIVEKAQRRTGGFELMVLPRASVVTGIDYTRLEALERIETYSDVAASLR